MEDLKKFRPIPGYQGLYSINLSNEVMSHEKYVKLRGNIKQLLKEKILKTAIDKRTGHLMVNLSKDGIKKNFGIHVLVALAWELPKKESDNCVEHKDDNPQNNHYSNLIWSNQSNNGINAHYRSNKQNQIKAVLQYDLQGNFIAKHDSASNAQRIFTPKLNQGSIKECLRNPLRRKSAYGFVWKYE